MYSHQFKQSKPLAGQSAKCHLHIVISAVDVVEHRDNVPLQHMWNKTTTSQVIVNNWNPPQSVEGHRQASNLRLSSVMFLIKHHTSEHYCVEPNMEIWLDNIHNVGRSFACKHNTKQSCDQRMRWCIMPGTATGPRRSQLDAYIPQEHTRGFICCTHAISINFSR